VLLQSDERPGSGRFPAASMAKALLTGMATALSPRGLGVLRTAVGVSAVARPTLIPRLLGVDRVTAERVTWLVRMLGAREIALGVGTLTTRSAGWLAAGAMSDLTDALSTAEAVRRRHLATTAGSLTAASALVAAAAGAAGSVAAARRHGA
jgi:hypothetical protein